MSKLKSQLQGRHRRPGGEAAVLLHLLLLLTPCALAAPQQEVFVASSSHNAPDFLQPTHDFSQARRLPNSIQTIERRNQASVIPVSQELLWLLQQIPARGKSFLSESRLLPPAVPSANKNILDPSLRRFSGSRFTDRGNLDEVASRRNIADPSFGRFTVPRTSNQNNHEDFLPRRLFTSHAQSSDAVVSPRLEAIQNIAQSSNLPTSGGGVSSPFQFVSSQPTTEDLLQIRTLQLQQLEQQQRLIELQNELLQYQRLLRQEPDLTQTHFKEQRHDRNDGFPVTTVNFSPARSGQQQLVASQSNSSPQLETQARLLASNPFQLRAREINEGITPVSQVVHTVTQTVFVPISTSETVEERGVDVAAQKQSHHAIQLEETKLNTMDKVAHLNAFKSTDKEKFNSDSDTPSSNSPIEVDTQATTFENNAAQDFEVEANHNVGVVGEVGQQEHEHGKRTDIPLENISPLDDQIRTEGRLVEIPGEKIIVSELESINFDIDHDVRKEGGADSLALSDAGADTILLSQKSILSTTIAPDSDSTSGDDPNLVLDDFIDALSRSVHPLKIIENSSISSSSPPTPSSSPPIPSSSPPTPSSSPPTPSSSPPIPSSSPPTPSSSPPTPSFSPPTPSSSPPTPSFSLPTPSSLLPTTSSSLPTPKSLSDDAKHEIFSTKQEDDAIRDQIHMKLSLIEQNAFESINIDQDTKERNSSMRAEDEVFRGNVAEEANFTPTENTDIFEDTEIKDLDSTSTVELFQHSEDTSVKFSPQEPLQESATFSEDSTPDDNGPAVEESDILVNKNDFLENLSHDALVLSPLPQNTESLDAQSDILIIEASNVPEKLDDDFSKDSHHDTMSSSPLLLNVESPDAQSDIFIVRDSNPLDNTDEDLILKLHHHPSVPLQATATLKPLDTAADVFIVTDSNNPEEIVNNFDVTARVLSEPVDRVPSGEIGTKDEKQNKNDKSQGVRTTLAPLVLESSATLRIFQNNAEIITNSPPQSEPLFNTVTPPSDEPTTHMLPIEAIFEKFNDDDQHGFQSQNFQEDESSSDAHDHSVNVTESDVLGLEFPEYDEFAKDNSVKSNTSIDEEFQHVLSSPDNVDVEQKEEIVKEPQFDSLNSTLPLQKESDVPSSNGMILVTQGPLEIDFDAPRIVERTVISVSSNVNLNSHQQAGSESLRTKSLAELSNKQLSDSSGNADQLAESHNVPTFTVFVNPKTGRIFKRSLPSIPEDMSSKLSQILKEKEKQMESANQRFRGRQGLFTMFTAERNSETSSGVGKSVSVANSASINERPRPFLTDRRTARKASPNAEPDSNRRKFLSNLRAQRMKKLQALTATSFSNRLGEAVVVDEDTVSSTSDRETSDIVEESPVPIAVGVTKSTNLEAVQQSQFEANPAKEPEKADADKQLTLQEQLKKLLRNKNTGDKVRRRLLSSRRSFRQKKGKQENEGGAKESSQSIPSTNSELQTTTVKPLRFNRFRNQAASRGTGRRDRVQTLASRFRNRHEKNKTNDVAKDEQETVAKEEKPSKPPNNRRFKVTRFEGLRRREQPTRRRPMDRLAATTTQKPALPSSTPSKSDNKISSTTTSKPIKAAHPTTQPSILRDVDENLIIDNRNTTVKPKLKSTDLPPFMAKFKEIISKTTQSPGIEVPTLPVELLDNDIFTPTLNEIGDESTTRASVKSTVVQLEPVSTSDLPTLADNLNFETSTPPTQTSPFTNSPVDDSTITEPFSRATEIFADLETTLPPLITVTSAPVPIIRINENVIENKQIKPHSPTFSLSDVISPRKLPAPVQDLIVKVQGEKLSDVFSRMLASISKQKENNILRNEDETALDVVGEMQRKEDESAIGSQFLGVGKKSVISKSPFAKDHLVVTGVPIHSVVASLSNHTQGFRPRIDRLPANLRPETTTTLTIIQERENISSTMQDIREAAAVISSVTDEPEELITTAVSSVTEETPTTMPSVTQFSETSPSSLSNNSLKARLMKGNFSLLVDGVLLEELAFASQNQTVADLPQSAENASLRLFDIPVIMNFANTTFLTEEPTDISLIYSTSTTSTESPIGDKVFSDLKLNNSASDANIPFRSSDAHVPFSLIEEVANSQKRPGAAGRSLQFNSATFNRLPEPNSVPVNIETEIATDEKSLRDSAATVTENFEADDFVTQELFPTTSHTPLFHEIFPSLFSANSLQEKDPFEASVDSETQLDIQFDNIDSEPGLDISEQPNLQEFSVPATDKPEINEMNFMKPNGSTQLEDSQSQLLQPVPLIPFQGERHLDVSQQIHNHEQNPLQPKSELAVKGVDDAVPAVSFGEFSRSGDSLLSISSSSNAFESELPHTTQRSASISDFNVEENLAHKDGHNIKSPNNFFPTEQKTFGNRGMVPERIDLHASPILAEVDDEFQNSFSPVIHSQLDRAFMPIVTDQPNNVFIPAINIHAKNKIFANTDTTVNDVATEGRLLLDDFTTAMPFSVTEPSLGADETIVELENVIPDPSLESISPATEFNFNSQPSFSLQTDSDPIIDSQGSHLIPNENNLSTLDDFINKLNPTTVSPFDGFNLEILPVDDEPTVQAEIRNELNPEDLNEPVLPSRTGRLFTNEPSNDNLIANTISPNPSIVSDRTTPRSSFTEVFDSADTHASEFSKAFENSATTQKEGLRSEDHDIGSNNAQVRFANTDLDFTTFPEEEQNPSNFDLTTKIIESPVEAKPLPITEVPLNSIRSPQILRTSLRDRQPSAVSQRSSVKLFPRPIPVEQPLVFKTDETGTADNSSSDQSGSQIGDRSIVKKKVIRITSLTSLNPSPPMNIHAAPTPRQLVPIPLEEEPSLASRRRRPEARTRGGNVRSFSSRNRTGDLSLVIPQPENNDGISGVESRILNPRKPESMNAADIVDIGKPQPNNFVGNKISSRNRAEATASVNQSVRVSSTSDTQPSENRILPHTGTPEVAVTTSRSLVGHENRESIFSHVDEASATQSSSIINDDVVVSSTTTQAPVPDNSERTRPQPVHDSPLASIDTHQSVHDIFNLQLKIDDNIVLQQGIQTHATSTVPSVSSLDFDTSARSESTDEGQQHASKIIPSHTHKMSVTSPTVESSQQDLQHIDSPARPVIISEPAATSQGSSSNNLPLLSSAKLSEFGPREEQNLPDAFIPDISSGTQEHDNENNESNITGILLPQLENISSSSIAPPTQTSTVHTAFRDLSVSDKAVATDDSLSTSDNAKLSPHLDATSISSMQNESDQSISTVLSASSHHSVDNLHNFTNDELLLLDLLADMVETPVTLPINPEPETFNQNFFSHEGNTATEQREPKSIDTSENVFPSQSVQFFADEFSKSDRNEQNFRDTPSFTQLTSQGRPVFPPPLPQFPQMPAITTPKPFANHLHFANIQQENQSKNRFGFTGNFPFHVFDSLTVNQPIRPRSVSSSSAPVNTVSPNFSFFQVFNPPQAASQRSQTVTPFPFLGRSVVQRKPSVAFRESVPHSIMNPPQDKNSRANSHPHSNSNSQHFTTNNNNKSKIVSMRTESGSLIFLPSEKVDQAMKIGMGTPLNISEMQKKNRRS
ncbi:hypothetical protein FHG87_011590 [Trinorchestia longiramus]|nr:hypothetical protein FHG87_011590 [Trinorchestia longiramus]